MKKGRTRQVRIKNFSSTQKSLSKMRKSGAKKSESTDREPKNKIIKIRGKQTTTRPKSHQKIVRTKVYCRVSLKSSIKS